MPNADTPSHCRSSVISLVQRCVVAITVIAMAFAVAEDEIQLPTAALGSHDFLCMFY